MKSYRKEIALEMPARLGFANITPDVEACLAESGIQAIGPSPSLSISRNVCAIADALGVKNHYHAALRSPRHRPSVVPSIPPHP